jgi:hypothetical protein
MNQYNFYERKPPSIDYHLMIRKNPGSLIIYFRWIGIQTLISNKGTFQKDPRKLSVTWLCVGVIMIILFGYGLTKTTSLDSGAQVLLLFFALAIILIYHITAHLVNYTNIVVTKEKIEVHSHPLPYKRRKVFESSSIRQVYFENNNVKGISNTGYPYSKIIAVNNNNKKITLFSIEGDRFFLKEVANEINIFLIRTYPTG